MKKFLIIGGDNRLIHVANYLSENYECSIFGAGQVGLLNKAENLNEFKGDYENIILPLPATRENESIFAPNHNYKILINDLLPNISKEATIYIGIVNEFWRSKFPNNVLIDYYDEGLAIKNTIPTAEGVVRLIMQNKQETIFGMDILVLGAGRTSKAICKLLLSLGAKVTVMARNAEEFLNLKISEVKYSELHDFQTILPNFNTVVNTIPTPIFNAHQFKSNVKNTLFVDISTCGVFENNDVPSVCDLNYIHALGIPGKYTPITAGRLIAENILKYL